MGIKRNTYTINCLVIQFRNLSSSYDLSNLLKFDFDHFISIIKNASYSEFTIPKKNGGTRTIEVPNIFLKQIQGQLNCFLQAVYYKIKPKAAYGFVWSEKDDANPHTIISNAQNHISKSCVLNIDLKDFFHSISAIKVRALFQSAPFNFSEDLATCLALICCWNKRLPMGAPTSPVISNLVCHVLDHQLEEIAIKHKLTYTRYADDLTFSSDSHISEETITEIKKVIAENDFSINERKFRMQSKFGMQTVTGIKVNEKTNVDRRYTRNVRAILNDIQWNGWKNAAIKHYNAKSADEKLLLSFLLSLKGKIDFIGQVRGKSDLVFNRLRQDFKLLEEIY